MATWSLYVDKEHMEMLVDKKLKLEVTILWDGIKENDKWYAFYNRKAVFDFSNVSKETRENIKGQELYMPVGYWEGGM